MRIGRLALAALLMLTISLSWVEAVDLTPAELRPYVGSTQDNSELSLALGYNGIDRLLGLFPFGRGTTENRSGNGPAGTPPSGDFLQPEKGQLPEGFGKGDPVESMADECCPYLASLFLSPCKEMTVTPLPLHHFHFLMTVLE